MRPLQDGSTGNGKRLIIVSNRGPIEHKDDDAGNMRQVGGSGGLATALRSALDGMRLTWIAATPGEDANAGRRIGLGDGNALQLIVPPPEAQRLSYGTFCSAILWFLQHDIWAMLQRDDVASEAAHTWRNGYLPVNRVFADAVVRELAITGAERVSIHDFHLYALPRMIRERRPDVTLQHFVHIPWPGPEAWAKLPAWIVVSICEGLLANDSVVFQTEASARRFLETCRTYLSNVTVDAVAGEAAYRGRRTHVWANPVSVHPEDLRARVASPAARPYRELLSAEAGEKTIVRVDRLDPAKNIIGGLRAYGRLLEDHPEWRGRVRFLSFLVPTRQNVPEYQSYASEVFREVCAINERYGGGSWRPVTVFHEHNRLQALVALTMYDVLLINSITDGMNLVAKEGVVVNERAGVVVLSKTTGAHEELHAGAFPIEPRDIEQTARALQAALTLPAVERRLRAERMREAVEAHNIQDWIQLLLADFAAVEASREPEAIIAGAV